MSSESDTAATDSDSESIATIPLSTAFCADDADVIIRAEGALDFHVHKCNLSLVSPVFKDMFTIPQPPADIPGVLPRVDVQDPPRTWENILRTIYPMPNPTIDNLDDLESLFFTAEKYEMEYVIYSHTRCFENLVFIREDPLRLYAIACTGGLEEQAKYVASRAELSTVVGRSSVSRLKCLTWDSYHRLVSFLVKRDKEWNQILTETRIQNESKCKCRSKEVYDKIREALRIPHCPTDDLYLNAIERSFQKCHPSCATSEIKGFIDSATKEKGVACKKLMW